EINRNDAPRRRHLSAQTAQSLRLPPLDSLPFTSILRPNLDGAGRPYVLHPSRHGSGWLLPADPALRRLGLSAFGQRGVKGSLGRSLPAAWLGGRRLWCDVGPLEGVLARALGEPDIRLAFCIGTSGAYRKLTAEVITSGGRVPAYAKIAVQPRAQASLGREHENLLRLSRVDALLGRVPGVLAWFGWRGAQVLVITAGSGRMGPSRFGEPHAEFLRPLHDAFHFQAMQAALAGRPYHPSLGRQHGLAAFWPEWRARLAPLYLAYLLDMGLFYTEARLETPESGDDREQRWFAHHIDIYM